MSDRRYAQRPSGESAFCSGLRCVSKVCVLSLELHTAPCMDRGPPTQGPGPCEPKYIPQDTPHPHQACVYLFLKKIILLYFWLCWVFTVRPLGATL